MRLSHDWGNFEAQQVAKNIFFSLLFLPLAGSCRHKSKKWISSRNDTNTEHDGNFSRRANWRFFRSALVKVCMSSTCNHFIICLVISEWFYWSEWRQQCMTRQGSQKYDRNNKEFASHAHCVNCSAIFISCFLCEVGKALRKIMTIFFSG